MATIYRLQKIKHNSTTLSGEGAAKEDNRWNYKGVPLVYTSSSISLAILETRVHLGSADLRLLPPSNIVVIHIPDEYIYEFDLTDLPPQWNEVPATETSRLFLAPWLEACNKLAFSVPSAINFYERNILVNPKHPDISRVVIERFDPFQYDSRLQ